MSIKERIDDGSLLEAASRAEQGLIDANLGGGVIKQRIARTGEGKSGGYRTIICFRRGQFAIFMFGFAKSDRANISAAEEQAFKKTAKHVLALTPKQMESLVEKGDFVEVILHEQNQ